MLNSLPSYKKQSKTNYRKGLSLTRCLLLTPYLNSQASRSDLHCVHFCHLCIHFSIHCDLVSPPSNPAPSSQPPSHNQTKISSRTWLWWKLKDPHLSILVDLLWNLTLLVTLLFETVSTCDSPPSLTIFPSLFCCLFVIYSSRSFYLQPTGTLPSFSHSRQQDSG